MQITATSNESPIEPTERIEEPDGSVTELTDIPIALADLGVAHNRVLRLPQIEALSTQQRGTLLSLCHDLFVDNWQSIVFGPCIQGAVFELELGEKPTQFSYLDGYLTVFLAPSPAHMHLCLGPHQGLKNETPSVLALKRQCKRAAFVRTIGSNCVPGSWSIQLFNGADQQMITFFLPSPFLDLEKEKRLRVPKWSHLDLWNQLRARYLGEQTPQPLPTVKSRLETEDEVEA